MSQKRRLLNLPSSRQKRRPRSSPTRLLHRSCCQERLVLKLSNVLCPQAKFPSVMALFKETREALLLSHASGFITDVEFLLLYEENMSDNLDFPYDEYPSFNLQDKNEAECKANFRVEKHHFSRLVDALDIPAVFKCQQGTVCEKE